MGDYFSPLASEEDVTAALIILALIAVIRALYRDLKESQQRARGHREIC